MSTPLSRIAFGLAILGCGLVTLVWGGPLYIYAIGAAQCIGGLGLLTGRTSKAGAIIVGAAYLALCLLSVPQIIAHPLIFASWGNFFYPFSLVVGAGVIFRPSLIRTACVLMGLCAASFGIEQVEFLARTATLVPKWIPPNQMFWAIATVAPFGLAAIALIANVYALLAARLYALMMALFGILVWIPIVIVDSHSHGNWDEGVETFAIAAAIWVLADRIAQGRSGERAPLP